MIDEDGNKFCTWCKGHRIVCLKTGALIEIGTQRFSSDAFVCNECGRITFFGIPGKDEVQYELVHEGVSPDFYVQGGFFRPYPTGRGYHYLQMSDVVGVSATMVPYFKQWYPSWYYAYGKNIPILYV